MAENSTNVRLLSAVLRGLGAISSWAAAGLAFQLFRLAGPRRHPRFTQAPDAVEHFRAGRHRVASYIWQGGGPTVVLVHGWNGTSADLRSFIGPLRDTGRRVVAIDLPAHGRSSGSRPRRARGSRSGFGPSSSRPGCPLRISAPSRLASRRRG